MKPFIYAIVGVLILLIITKKTMKKSFDDYFKAVFDVETDRKNIHKVITDSGGLTKYGISDLADKIKDGKYFGDDIASMTPLRASQIYQTNYFTPYANYFKEYPNFALQVFDISINSGVGKAKEMVNKILGVNNFGAALQKIVQFGETKATMLLINERKRFYNELAISNPSKYGQYLKGWENRLKNLKFS